jgi:hypothetical protein
VRGMAPGCGSPLWFPPCCPQTPGRCFRVLVGLVDREELLPDGQLDVEVQLELSLGLSSPQARVSIRLLTC